MKSNTLDEDFASMCVLVSQFTPIFVCSNLTNSLHVCMDKIQISFAYVVKHNLEIQAADVWRCHLKPKRSKHCTVLGQVCCLVHPCDRRGWSFCNLDHLMLSRQWCPEGFKEQSVHPRRHTAVGSWFKSDLNTPLRSVIGRNLIHFYLHWEKEILNNKSNGDVLEMWQIRCGLAVCTSSFGMSYFLNFKTGACRDISD